MFQPHAHRAHAAQDLVGIVSRCAQSKRSVRFQKLRPAFFIGRNRAKQNIGVAGRIFGRGMDGNVHAEIERLEVKRGGPRIVHHDDGAALVRFFNDGRNILHFKRVRRR